MRLLRYVWAGPVSCLGLLLVPLAWLGRGRVRVVDGVLEASGGLLDRVLRHAIPLRGGASALTLGHVVLARDAAAADRTRPHERVHVAQCERWGPLFLPAYLAASLVAMLRNGNFYRDNWFERMARRATETLRDPGEAIDNPAEHTTVVRQPRDRSGSMALATFGAGCFWGVELGFRQVKGVTDAVAGYLGGHLENPTYQDVCTGTTGHAEVVQVEFDPAVVSYEELLDIFWRSHDPTTLNRQGPDIGTQYRSAIFYHTPEQAELARRSKQAVAESGKFPRPIVTEITPATTFYRAEEYHQRYLEKHGLASCHFTPRDD